MLRRTTPPATRGRSRRASRRNLRAARGLGARPREPKKRRRRRGDAPRGAVAGHVLDEVLGEDPLEAPVGDRKGRERVVVQEEALRRVGVVDVDAHEGHRLARRDAPRADAAEVRVQAARRQPEARADVEAPQAQQPPGARVVARGQRQQRELRRRRRRRRDDARERGAPAHHLIGEIPQPPVLGRQRKSCPANTERTEILALVARLSTTQRIGARARRR